MVLRSCFFYLTFYPWTVLILLVALPISLLGENRIHNIGIFWGRSCLHLAGIRLRVKGAEHIPHGQPAIYLANHQSNFDIPILYGGLPLQFRWLAKWELFRFPLFGLAMKRCGYIPIDRSSPRQSLASLNQAARQVQQGTSLVIFPEGTRTYDGQLQDFKKGGGMIAVKAQVPLIPVAINGSYAVMPRSSWWIRSGAVELVIFPPIATTDKSLKDLDDLMAQVRRPIADLLEGTLSHDRNAN